MKEKQTHPKAVISPLMRHARLPHAKPDQYFWNVQLLPYLAQYLQRNPFCRLVIVNIKKALIKNYTICNSFFLSCLFTEAPVVICIFYIHLNIPRQRIYLTRVVCVCAFYFCNFFVFFY